MIRLTSALTKLTFSADTDRVDISYSLKKQREKDRKNLFCFSPPSWIFFCGRRQTVGIHSVFLASLPLGETFGRSEAISKTLLNASK
jgi:hypothetical protein